MHPKEGEKAIDKKTRSRGDDRERRENNRCSRIYDVN